MKKFTNEHEWIELIDNIGTVGITDYAQNQLGDVVYVSLTKQINDIIKKGDDIAEIESVKSVSQVFSPVNGKLIEFNTIFENEANSALINSDPYNKGWIFKIGNIDMVQFNELMSEENYQKYISTL
jgi:glycine cleavage system H protein